MTFQETLAKEAALFSKEVLCTPLDNGAMVTFICMHTKESSPCFSITFKENGNFDTTIEDVDEYTARMTHHGLQIISNTMAELYTGIELKDVTKYAKDTVIGLYEKIKAIKHYRIPIFELELRQVGECKIEIIKKDDAGNDIFRYTYTDDEVIRYMVKVGNSILLERGSPIFNVNSLTDETIISLVGMYHDELLKHL